MVGVAGFEPAASWVTSVMFDHYTVDVERDIEAESELEVRILNWNKSKRLKFEPVVPERRIKKQRLFSLSSILNRILSQHVAFKEDLTPTRSALEDLGVPEIEPGPMDLEIPNKTPKRRFKPKTPKARPKKKIKLLVLEDINQG
ncbi:unnamed protein product [Mucor hiemalis]